MARISHKETSHFPPDDSIYLGSHSIVSADGKTVINAGDQYAGKTSMLRRGFLHRVDGLTHPGPPYRTGGGVSIRKYTDDTATIQNSGSYTDQSLGWSRHYNGGFISDPYLMSLANAAGYSPTNGEIDPDWFSSYANGATGWNRFAPGNAMADASVFLAEMRELPRMLMGTAKFFWRQYRRMGGSRHGWHPKHVADEFLNQQFGWFPFLSDLRKFYRTYRNLDDRIAKIKKHNGRWLKRGGTISNDVDSAIVGGSETITGHWPTLTSGFYVDPQNTGSHEIELVKQETTWFEGRFRYYIPDIDTPEWNKRVVRQLYGLTISPGVLWELTPWSWLVDWFSNAGDVIDNLNNNWADHLAAKYAYVMGKRDWTWKIRSTHRLKDGTLSACWSPSLVVKDRHKANPFGFGLTMDTLSTRQTCILAALGLSRAKVD